MPKATCSSCGREVQRTPTSRPEIICNPCRRASPKYQHRKQLAEKRRLLPEPGQATCPICGEAFQQRIGGLRAQKYCSLSCRNRRPRNESEDARERRRQADRERDKRRPRIHGRTITKPCVGCGEPFASRPVDQQKYCSRQCPGRAQPKPQSCKLIYRDCLECGRLFISRQGRKFCGDDCARLGHLRAQREYNKGRLRKSSGLCTCGVPLPSTRRKKCDACVRLVEQERKRQERKRHRRVKLGIKGEVYTLAYIARRDRYRCGLCRKRVAMAKAVPHPKAPTIDHIIPLDAGGDDTRANVQLAHFICNSLKSNRGGGEQLRLIG